MSTKNYIFRLKFHFLIYFNLLVYFFVSFSYLLADIMQISVVVGLEEGG